MEDPARSTAERIARDAYGRLVAIVAMRSGDLSGAEDALADALVAALEHWPREGPPANPSAWLLTVARRKIIDRARRGSHAVAGQAELLRMHEEAEERMNDAQPFADNRLGLMLACAHPAIDPAARTPLMLQAVLGLSAQRMASAFMMSPAAMTKRLVRAKAKLAEAGIGFVMPGPEAMSERIDRVLEAVYGAFTLARSQRHDAELESEAIWLGQLVVDLAADEPEAIGLLSLMLFIAARPAPDPRQAFVPLGEQDPASWDGQAIAEAERLLRRAGRAGRPGRFQLEASIQAVHAARRHGGATDWQVVVDLYDRLLDLAPTIGATIGRAAALAQAGDAPTALGALGAIEPARVAAHQPFWATLAFVLAQLDRRAEAAGAYERAAGLCDSTPVRRWLLERRAAILS